MTESYHLTYTIALYIFSTRCQAPPGPVHFVHTLLLQFM